jgi:hypothetical protein
MKTKRPPMKLPVILLAFFTVFGFGASTASCDLLACYFFLDGFFEVEVKSERAGENGAKVEVYRETKVGKDSLLFEFDSREGNSVVFIVKPVEDTMVVMSLKNVNRGQQYMFTGMVNRQGELFAVSW